MSKPKKETVVELAPIPMPPLPPPEPKIIYVETDRSKEKMKWAFANLRDFNETVGIMIAVAFCDTSNKISMSEISKMMPYMPSGEIDRLFKLLHVRGRGRYNGQIFELVPEAFIKKGSF